MVRLCFLTAARIRWSGIVHTRRHHPWASPQSPATGDRWCRRSAGTGAEIGAWVKDIHNLPTFSQHPLEIFHGADDLVPIPRLLNDPLPPLLGEGLPSLGGFKLKEHRTVG